MKGSHEETVEDGNRPTESLVDLVPSCGEYLDYDVGNKDKYYRHNAEGDQSFQPKRNRQNDIYKKINLSPALA